jgi:hypothetical protein
MPAARIEKPTPFDQWLQTKTLFEDGATKTETHVTHGHDEGIRHAYGRSSGGWCFYIEMTAAQEPVFWQVYHEWVKRSSRPEARHVASVSATKPPNCGTPNTPDCEAITALAAPGAGAGVRAA